MTGQPSAVPVPVLQYREVRDHQNGIGEWVLVWDEWTDFDSGDTLSFSGDEPTVEVRVKP